MHRDDWNETVEFTTDMSTEVSRREFLQLAGAGLFIFFAIDPMAALQEPSRLPGRPSYPTDFNAYLRIGPDGRVTGFSGKVELGQGSTTALAQLLAEELDVPYDSVDMVLGDTGRCPWDMGTFGSLCHPAIRSGAARGRRRGSRDPAAVGRRTPASAGGTAAGQSRGGERPVLRQARDVRPAGGRQADRAAHRARAGEAGRGVHGGRTCAAYVRTALDKVTGKGQYAGDIKLPGILHARLVRPPAHGATLKSVDTSAAEKIPGVRARPGAGMIAVLHEQWDVAEAARGLVKAEFERPAVGPDDRTIFEHLLKTAPPPQVVFAGGDLEAGEKLASAVVEHEYLNGYVSHAPMETHTATASIEGGKVTVWASTQAPFPVKTQVAQALGVSPENVRVITPYVGGGFGGQERVPAGGRSGAAGEDHGQAGAGGMGPRGGVLLRHLPARRGREDPLGRRRVPGRSRSGTTR